MRVKRPVVEPHPHTCLLESPSCLCALCALSLEARLLPRCRWRIPRKAPILAPLRKPWFLPIPRAPPVFPPQPSNASPHRIALSVLQ